MARWSASFLVAAYAAFSLAGTAVGAPDKDSAGAMPVTGTVTPADALYRSVAIEL